MPRFEITGPDGGRFEITAPEGASEADVLSFAQSNFGAASQSASKPQVDAPSSGFLMGLRDPLDGGAQLLRRVVPDAVGNAMDTFGSWLASKGFPVAPTQGVEGVDKLVKEVNEAYEAKRKDAGVDWARLGGNLLNPLNHVGGGAIKGAATAGKLAASGAKAGAVGASIQPVVDQQDEYWKTKLQQAGTGAAFGAVAVPAAAKIGESGAKLVNAGASKVKGFTVSQNKIDVATANALRSGGIDATALPQQVLESVKAYVAQAMQSGAKLDAKAIVRKAEFELAGLSGDAAPTAGQLSRDPMQWANEKNLSGVRMANGGNPLADRFQSQSAALAKIFDDAGATAAREPVLAGQDLQQALVNADAPVKSAVGQAYEAARSMSGGRSAELDRWYFSQTVNKALDDGMWGHFVPPNVRSLLNGVSDGSTPFTVEAAEQIDSILAKAQRTAGNGSAESSAIGIIRQSLRGTPFAQETAPLGDNALVALSEGQVARDAFGQARDLARNRFNTIDETPALAAALDGEAPDAFVLRYIIGGKLSELKSLKSVLASDDAAIAQIRAQLAEHLKTAAFGANAAGDKAFSPERYANALKAIGNEKLKLFFSTEEVTRMNVAAKVAANINSRPAGAAQAVNSSGTAASLFNFLTRIPVVGSALRDASNGRQIRSALNPQNTAGSSTLTPKQIDAVRKIFTKPATASAGLAGGIGF